MSVCGVGEGVDGGWMPLPTRPQLYCDPAPLVRLHLALKKKEQEDFKKERYLFLSLDNCCGLLSPSSQPPPVSTLFFDIDKHRHPIFVTFGTSRIFLYIVICRDD